MIGKTFSHYKILEQLGKGGMGEVYLADDLSLNRKVALKFLPDVFTGDPERMARFEREAKLLASLNHQNIAAIYGLEQANGNKFLVLEYVEGETLRARLNKGALSIEDTLTICLQIAEGLKSAHKKGIIHRDLKPANVMITADEKVKILDFGLAKALADKTQSIDSPQTPTLTGPMTRQGVILGTAAYMSPEQARGKTVDKRADIWAFGCVLFEMLTGRAAFSGDGISDILAAVLRGEPDWKSLPANLHWRLREIVDRCLKKDVRDRYHDISDVRLDIQKVTADPEGPSSQPSAIEKSGRRFQTILPWIAAAVVLTTIVVGVTVWNRDKTALPGPLSMVASTIKIEPGLCLAGRQALQGPSRTAMAISSDGKFIVYCAIKENPGAQDQPQLYLRRMDQLEATPIAGTEGGMNPFLSPDNRWVGFMADGKIKKIPVEGGIAATLCDLFISWGASWGPDDSIIFTKEFKGGLVRISVAEGGKPETLTKPDRKQGEYAHRLPFCLPDGKSVVFTIMRNMNDNKPSLALLRLDSREWRVLLEDAADARYVSTGHLIFLRKGTLMAVRFDPATPDVIGQPVPLIKNVIQGFSKGAIKHTGAGQFGISETGSLIYASGGVAPPSKNSLMWVDQEGNEQPVTDKQLPFAGPRLSPDGLKIAYCKYTLENEIWVYDISTGTNTPLTREMNAAFPIWIPGSNRLIFPSNKSGVMNLFSQACDGSSPMERITTSEYDQFPASASSNGNVAFIEINPVTAFDINLLDLHSKQVTPFLNSASMESHPEFSPDGRWIAYTSNVSKRYEVYVQPFPATGTEYTISNEGGTMPLWAKDMKQLFYRCDDQVWVVDVRTDGGFQTSKSRMLFEKPGYMEDWTDIRTYDLSVDGKRFLMVKEEQQKAEAITEMIFVQNWFEELKQKVPKE